MDNTEKKTGEGEVLEIDLLQIIRVIWKKIWIVGLSAAVTGIIAFVYTAYLVVPLYTSSVMLYVNNNSVSLGSASLSISSADLTAAQKLVNTYLVILQSRSTLEEVIREARVDYTFEQLSGMINAEAVNATEIFRVSVTGPNPSEAERIANIIAEVLPDRIAEVVDGSSVRVVDRAVIPSHRTSPSMTKNVAVGVVIGVVLSAGAIVLRSLFDTRISSKSYLTQSYDIPVLAVIPDLNVSGDGQYYYSKSRRGVSGYRLAGSSERRRNEQRGGK